MWNRRVCLHFANALHKTTMRTIRRESRLRDVTCVYCFAISQSAWHFNDTFGNAYFLQCRQFDKRLSCISFFLQAAIGSINKTHERSCYPLFIRLIYSIR